MLVKFLADDILKYLKKDNLHEMSNPVFLEKIRKLSPVFVCWISQESDKG